MANIYKVTVLVLLIILQDAEDFPLRQSPCRSRDKRSTSLISTSITEHLNRWDPSFAKTEKKVSVTVGESAQLSCRVNDIAMYGISWIRHSDVLILTFKNYVYSTSEKFKVNYIPERGSSTLTIIDAQKRDAGIYECQVNTQPVISYIVKLEVVDNLQTQTTPIDDIYHQMFSDTDPFAYIIGGPNISVTKGSLVNITCVTRHMQSNFLAWFHKNNTIIEEFTKGRLNMITERSNRIVSQLIIPNVRESDAGTYTCRPSDTYNVTIELFVNGATVFKITWITLVMVVLLLNGTY